MPPLYKAGRPEAPRSKQKRLIDKQTSIYNRNAWTYCLIWITTPKRNHAIEKAKPRKSKKGKHWIPKTTKEQQQDNNKCLFSTERSGNDLMSPPRWSRRGVLLTATSARRYQATPPSTAYLNSAFNLGPVPAPTNLAAVVFLSCSGKIDGGLLEIWLHFIRQF